MYIIRPIKEEDLNAYYEFACTSSLGVINLPKNRTLLKDKIKASIQAFQTPIDRPHLENYIFVLENRVTGELGGTCGITSRMGVTDPHYYYKVEIHRNELTGQEIKILFPVCYPIGPSEICALYLKPSFRKEGIGKLLSLSRFLFVASHRKRFEDTIVAEMRGYIKDNDSVPFWEAIGKKFLNISYAEFCEKEQQSRAFVSQMIPQWPIYVFLLPQEAQDCIAKTHDKTVPALKLLYNEGFKFSNEIDPFDGGPKIICKTDEILTIKTYKKTRIQAFIPENDHDRTYLISNTTLDFRVCYGNIFLQNDGVAVTEEVGQALNLKIDDEILYVKVPLSKEEK